jgi:dolichyl-phosphate-mannose-protein mannosyltransferase
MKRLKHFLEWEYTLLFMLIVMVLILHFSTITKMPEGTFDEVFYIPAAKSILSGESLGRIEHPPLAQAIIAAGIGIFGDNPLGWRFFPIIFGTVSLIILYLICRKLKLPKITSLLAVYLFSIDSLSFIQSSLAMLDVYSLTFMLLSFWLYLKGGRWNYLTGLSIALATLCKLTGVLSLLCIFLYWVINDRKNIKQILLPGFVAVASFLALLPLIDFAIMHKFLNPITQVQNMMEHTMKLTFKRFEEGPQSRLLVIAPTRPWEWIYHLIGAPQISLTGTKDNDIQVYVYALATINPAIWIFIVPSSIYLIYMAIRRSTAATFACCWFAGTYLVWIPLSLITNRVSYDYYFYPTVGVICIGISMGITKILSLENRHIIFLFLSRYLIPVYLGVAIFFFISFYLGYSIPMVVWAASTFLLIYYFLEHEKNISRNPLTS